MSCVTTAWIRCRVRNISPCFGTVPTTSASEALLRLAWHEREGSWAERQCAAALRDHRPEVRDAAATALGHLARREGGLETATVIRVTDLRTDPRPYSERIRRPRGLSSRRSGLLKLATHQEQWFQNHMVEAWRAIVWDAQRSKDAPLATVAFGDWYATLRPDEKRRRTCHSQNACIPLTKDSSSMPSP